MKKTVVLTCTVVGLAMPATAALFAPKGDSPEQKRAEVCRQRDDILPSQPSTQPPPTSIAGGL